jgi:hypothetical protein
MENKYTEGGYAPGTPRATGRIRAWAATRVDERTTRVAEQAEPVIRALQSAATRLDEDGAGYLAGHARRAAGRLHHAATYLRDENTASMLKDVSAFARIRPGLFVGLSFVAGVALGRALREPSAKPYDVDEFGAGPPLAAVTPGGP